MKVLEKQAAQIKWRGAKAASGTPSIAIFFSMMGFAAVAREAGFDGAQTIMTSILVYGMPGQVAMASLYMSGASVFVIVTAVALANMRMLLMTASGMEMIGLNDSNPDGGKMAFWKKLLLMQILAITSWVYLGQVQAGYSKKQLLWYFIGLASFIYIAGIAGTVAGYFIGDFVSDDILRIILVLTPMYILLMVINARQIQNRYAGILGGIICTFAFPFVGEFGIVLGGIVGGTLAVVIRRRRHHD